jgi:hypothetical protein
MASQSDTIPFPDLRRYDNFFYLCPIKVKIKWSRYMPGVVQRVGRGIALLFHDRGTRREWVVSSTPRPLYPRETRYPFYRRLGGPHGRSGRAENLVPTGIRSRTVQPAVTHYTDWATRPTPCPINVKEKIRPRTDHENSEGEQMYISTLPSTSALDRDGWSTPHPGRSLPPGETRYPLCRPQGRSGRVRKISPPPGFDPRTVQPVASRYTDWAIAAHLSISITFLSLFSHSYLIKVF